MNILRDGEELGMVIFSNEARITARLTVVSDDTRPYLLDKLPTFADGATSIGAGRPYVFYSISSIILHKSIFPKLTQSTSNHFDNHVFVSLLFMENFLTIF